MAAMERPAAARNQPRAGRRSGIQPIKDLMDVRTTMRKGLTAIACALAVGTLALAAGARPARAQDSQGDVANGAELYDLCSYCHGPAGLGNRDLAAPAIAGLDEWYVLAQLKKFREGQRGLHPDDIEGMRMRPMSLTLQDDQQIADVAAYVATLEPQKPEITLQGGDPAQGAGRYAVCIACHGPDASGMQPLSAPPLKFTGDWYLLAQLRKFKSGVRGRNPGDATGAQMIGMVATLPDEQAMLDVIAHIMTLSK